MFDTYKRIEELCEIKGVNITQMCKEANIPRASLSELKAGRKKTLGASNLSKIAQYFNVTVDFLLGIEKAPANGAEADDEMAAILESARRDPDKRILFSLGAKATPQQVKKYIEMIKIICGDDNGSGNN